MKSEDRFGPPTTPHIEVPDKVRTGLLLGTFLWLLDTALNLFTERIGSLQKGTQGIIVVVVFFVALAVAFWLAQKVFRLPIWRNAQHDAFDRIWVAIFAAGVQLALEFVGLRRISDGKLVMSALYAVVCSFGSISEYRSSHKAQKNSGGAVRGNAKVEENVVLVEELKEMRGRVSIASAVSFGSLLLMKLVLQSTHFGTRRAEPYVFLAAVAVSFSAFLFCSVHNRCPRCGKSLKKRERGLRCVACGLGDGRPDPL